MIALDTNVIVSSLLPAHTRFQRSAAVVEELLAKGERFVVPGPALREAYSVLTKLPPAVRLSPHQALMAIEATVHPPAFVADPAVKTWPLLHWCSNIGAVSGQIHDAYLAHVAAAAGATILLTWNVRHMRAVAPPGLVVREP